MRRWPETSRNSGPRLPSTGTDTVTHKRRPEDISDPAEGEAVPRCWCCGLPDLPDSRLTLFSLTFEGRPAGRWRLCEDCYYRRNPPPTQADADPLRAA